MTEIKKKRRRKVKIKDVIVKPQYKKSVKSGMTTVVKPDRITSNLSLEAFNGCWVGFGFESDVQPDETMEQAKRMEQIEFLEKEIEEANWSLTVLLSRIERLKVEQQELITAHYREAIKAK